MPPDPELVKLVSHIHTLATERKDQAVVIICELAAEYLFNQAKEAIDVEAQTAESQPESPPVPYSPPGGDLELKRELNQARLDLAASAHAMAELVEERGKKASAARDAQKRYRENLKKRNGKRKRKDVRNEGHEPAGNANG